MLLIIIRLQRHSKRQEMLLQLGFRCLELCLYGIRKKRAESLTWSDVGDDFPALLLSQVRRWPSQSEGFCRELGGGYGLRNWRERERDSIV